jgi:hypothetical protein
MLVVEAGGWRLEARGRGLVLDASDHDMSARLTSLR